MFISKALQIPIQSGVTFLRMLELIEKTRFYFKYGAPIRLIRMCSKMQGGSLDRSAKLLHGHPAFTQVSSVHLYCFLLTHPASAS